MVKLAAGINCELLIEVLLFSTTVPLLMITNLLISGTVPQGQLNGYRIARQLQTIKPVSNSIN